MACALRKDRIDQTFAPQGLEPPTCGRHYAFSTLWNVISLISPLISSNGKARAFSDSPGDHITVDGSVALRLGLNVPEAHVLAKLPP